MDLTPTIRSRDSRGHSGHLRSSSRSFARPSEADLVEALRRADALTVSAVAVIGNCIVGHVAFSPVTIDHDSALALAPVAVAPAYQRQGIGAALIRCRVSTSAWRLGHDIVIVLGEPAYESPVRFIRLASQFGIECPFSVPSEAFMVLVAFAECGSSTAWGWFVTGLSSSWFDYMTSLNHAMEANDGQPYDLSLS